MITNAQKLRLILKLSQLTQEKLAAKIGVSFVAFNNWINKKSVPRKKAEERINELYLLYTGQKMIPNSEIIAKKKIILNESKKFGNILQALLKEKDLYDQFILSFTYHTNSIEGSTLSENETAAILFRNQAFKNHSLIEQLEAKNHQAALVFLINYLQSKKNRIDETLILKLHAMLMNGIRVDAGYYRQHGVRIVGASVPTANYIKVPSLMKSLSEDIMTRKRDIISHASKIHSKFEKIHPFSDGNGRIGRLILNGMLLQANIAPSLIKQENKQLYYACLNKSQMKEDYSSFEDFVCDSIFEGIKLLKRDF